jgi:hypothetical protein
MPVMVNVPSLEGSLLEEFSCGFSDLWGLVCPYMSGVNHNSVDSIVASYRQEDLGFKCLLGGAMSLLPLCRHGMCWVF